MQFRAWPYAVVLSLQQVLGGVNAHERRDREATLSPEYLTEQQKKWSHDWAFSGISTFAHLPHVRCLTHPEERFDIGIIGVPFDTAVSYRPGARFGPRSIPRRVSSPDPTPRLHPRAGINPYADWAKIIDCGDIPVTPFDNALALRQMSEGFVDLGRREGNHSGKEVSATSKPRLITLGGDHSLALPALRSLRLLYGEPITVLHFDAHLDTWHPGAYDSSWLDPSIPIEQQQSSFNHGSMFWLARQEGLLSNLSVHAGLRCRLQGQVDDDSDTSQGWLRIPSDAISSDELGIRGVADMIMDRIGTKTPVYLSVDIDVLDPGLAPATGTPEPGGWLTRELIRVLRAIDGLNLVGADVVEVSPGFDGAGEQTSLAAAQVVYELLTSMVKQRKRDVTLGTAGGSARDEL